jgi:hypothetical protein
MTPWELASKSEHSHQRALFAWTNCAAQYGFTVADDIRGYDMKTRGDIRIPGYEPVPELARLFAIHNQGHGDAIRGGKAKAEGVKAGVPDIMLPVPSWNYPGQIRYCGLFIELKRPKVGVTSEKQSDWLDYLNEAGYRCHVCYGWCEAADAIRDYLA